jgi:para-nitrobenzyl esterase
MKRRAFIRGVVLAGAAVASRSALSLPTGVSPVVKTRSGPVIGYVEEQIYRFKGLRYGEAPTESLRFRPARKPRPWKAPYGALNLPSSAMQLTSGGGAVSYPGNVGPALNQVFGASRDRLRQSEDCLFLNVWTPSLDNADRPVMVWFHGGGHNYGSGSWPAYDGHNLARDHGVVVVTVNHRLNVFGYLAVGADPGESVNVGELDLVLALEWVRDNIAGFGGSPDNVTIFGQSGGGSKVSHCLIMPAARGLLHRAIIQSGGGLSSGDLDEAREIAERIAHALGHTARDIEALQRVPADALLAAAVEAGGRFGPAVDGNVVPRAPFTPAAPEAARDVPLIIGYTKDERTLYNVGLPWWGTLTDEQLGERARETYGAVGDDLIAAYGRLHPAYSNDYLYTDITNSHAWRAPQMAERKATQGGAPVWLYQWDWEAPVDNGILRAPHTMEIPFVFNNVDKGPILLGHAPSTHRLGYVASRSWTEFARTGDPNVPGLPGWPAYDTASRATMMFDVQSHVEQDPLGPARKLMDGAEEPDG